MINETEKGSLPKVKLDDEGFLHCETCKRYCLVYSGDGPINETIKFCAHCNEKHIVWRDEDINEQTN